MGGKLGNFVKGQAQESVRLKRSQYNQKLETHNGRKKFGKSDTREVGLSDSEIGPAPKMAGYSKGFMGAAEHSIDLQSQGFSGMELHKRKQGFNRDRLRRGFGGGTL